MKRIGTMCFCAAAVLLAASCSSSDQGSSVEAKHGQSGPITIWLSNNEQELEWGHDAVDAWNSDHPHQEVQAQEIPAGASSEEAITAAITAGTSPCLVYNISSAAVPSWVRQGGLVNLSDFDDGRSYIEQRTGKTAEIYQTDGDYYQVPWKSNPVMVMYNKAIFADAGLDAEDPDMATFETFIEAAQKIVDSGAAPTAIWPDPTSQFFQSWFDFYPLYLAETEGTPLVEDDKATFNDDHGKAVGDFWNEIYSRGLAPPEQSTDDAMSTGETAMQLAGPWAIGSYAESVEIGFMSVPTSQAHEEVYTFADSKNISLFTACENQATAWEFLKFTTSEENDGALLEKTGQMPMRTDIAETYSDYFSDHPEYAEFADQAERVADVPSIEDSVEVWQVFRDEYSTSIIFDQEPVADFLSNAADEIDRILDEGR